MLKRYLGLAAKQATVRYWGTNEAGRKAQFEADAVVRAAAGWRAIHKITEWPVNKPGLDLVVTYEMEAAEDEATPAGDPPRPATSRGGPNRVAAVRIALSRALPYVCYALFFAGVANFLWFCAEGPPQLFTRISISPKFFLTASTVFSISLGLLISQTDHKGSFL